jgi:hypothetical protein
MKAKYLGTAVLAAALALAGCGGKTEFTITGAFYNAGGAVTGVPNAGMELTNGNDTISIPVGATSFSFPTTVDYGDTFNVVISKQPQHMTCTPPNTSGTAGRTESVSIPIVCSQNAYSVLVAVTGLTEAAATDARLQLINGSAVQEITAAAPAASFTSIPVGSAYGVTIFQQPKGQTCTIVNGSGIMGDADRADAVVTCTATGT